MVAVEDLTEEIIHLSEVLQTAMDNTAKVQKRYSKKPREPVAVLSVGDRVMRLNVRSQQRKGGKLDPNYHGPFTIIKIEGKSADLQDDNGIVCLCDGVVKCMEFHQPTWVVESEHLVQHYFII